MNVLSSKELRARITFDEHGKEILPVFGRKAKEAWKQLEDLVLAPLCRSDKLDDLLYGGGEEVSSTSTQSRRYHGKRSICTGVLLAGPTGEFDDQ